MCKEEIQSDLKEYGIEEILAQYMMNSHAEELVREYIDNLKESLKESMEAMRKNLVYAQFKDETVLYVAYKKAEKLLNQ